MHSYYDKEIREKFTPEEQLRQEERLEQYVTALYTAFLNKPNYHIIVNAINQHMGGSVKKAIQLLDQRVKFVHYIQHDIVFVRDINHSALVKTLKEYPSIVKLVRFNIYNNVDDSDYKCWNQTEADVVKDVNEIQLTRYWKWSDMNHFTSVAHYNEILNHLKHTHDFIENYMMASIKRYDKTCNTYNNFAPHLYGRIGAPPAIVHKDGRSKYTVPEHKQAP